MTPIEEKLIDFCEHHFSDFYDRGMCKGTFNDSDECLSNPMFVGRIINGKLDYLTDYTIHEVDPHLSIVIHECTHIMLGGKSNKGVPCCDVYLVDNTIEDRIYEFCLNKFSDFYTRINMKGSFKDADECLVNPRFVGRIIPDDWRVISDEGIRTIDPNLSIVSKRCTHIADDGEEYEDTRCVDVYFNAD